MAAAVEFGSTIAGSVADTAAPVGRTEEREASDEFEFDDDEMQRLAAELSKELDGGSRSPASRAPVPVPEPEAEEPQEEEFDFDLGDDLLEEDDEEDFGFSTSASPGNDATFGDSEAAPAPEPEAPEPEPEAPAPEAATPAAAAKGLLALDDDLLNDLFADLEGDDDTSLDHMVRSSFTVGMSYYNAGKYDDAIVEFQRAVKNDDETSQALEYQGNAMRRTHDFRGAVDAFKQLLGRSKNDEGEVLRVMYELGVTYEAAGNIRGAYKIFKKITDRDPTFRGGEVADRVTSLADQLGLA